MKYSYLETRSHCVNKSFIIKTKIYIKNCSHLVLHASRPVLEGVQGDIVPPLPHIALLVIFPTLK
jgi:hypothetical protein